ncbi:MAG: efflux RND transporter permease subunit, partial [Chloroflexi bacterium]|nr:efflux RND transporter permease subunit [Chloroflexota bacterium]
MHWLTRISIAKRWLTLLVVLAVIGVCVYASLQLKVEMIPDIELPMTTVITAYPGASPGDVMDQVTVPIEAVVAAVEPAPRHITSTSTNSISFIYAEFEYGTDMTKVNAAISAGLAELSLPSSVRDESVVSQMGGENPKVYPINMSELALVELSFSSEGMDAAQLKALVISDVLPALQSVAGVSSVSVVGGDPEQQYLVIPDAEKMNAHGISMSQVVAAIENRQFASQTELENTTVDGYTLLSDVADVDLGPAPDTQITHTNGASSVGITIKKTSDANTVSTGSAVMNEIEDIQAALVNKGYNVEVVKVFDQADYVNRSISELAREGIIGGVLAVIIILLFLMTVRGSLVVAVSIPLSILIGFAVMRAFGITINILTLTALAIAVGRIVDDSIVFLEVTYRHLRQGEGYKEAALNGAREVATAVTSATIATVAIFLPLAFVGGIVGQLFVPFALTVTFALLASLLVALTVVPSLSSLLVPKKQETATRESWYQRIYVPVLKWALRHRAVTLIVAVGLFAGRLGLVPLIG